jgi:hypothetical protein
VLVVSSFLRIPTRLLQAGEKPKDPRHCYANPTSPEICLLLSLGIFFAVCPFDVDQVRLFPGGNQYERYSKALNRLLGDPDVEQELRLRGLFAADIGSHSTRKGAASYVASGSTACPSHAAITLRAGWKMPGVQDTYVRYEAAGDMFVGRTVAGLPFNSHLFSVLPPHFLNTGDAATAVTTCFPHFPPNLARILEMSLASMVYHADFLHKNLPAKHPLFSTPLFADASLIPSLQPKVICRCPLPGDSITATGIPPHISMLTEIQECSKQIATVVPAVDAAVPKMVDGVIEVLEERAIGAGTVTRNGLESMLTSVLDKAGLFQAVEMIRKRDASDAQMVSSSSVAHGSDERKQQAYLWGGSFHRVPESFSFPVGGVRVCWQQYCCGDSTKGYPPLKALQPRDMPSANLRKRLCDFLFLMKRVETKVREKNKWKPNPNLAEANEMFDAGQEALSLPVLPHQTHQRRTNQLSWLSLVQLLRMNDRRKSVESPLPPS